MAAHVEQIHEEVVRERARPLGEDTVRRRTGIRIQRAHATRQHRHLRHRELELARTVDQRLRADPP